MNACLTALVVALASPASAFQPSPLSRNRPPVAVQNSLRDMASYPDDQRMMSDLEAFDRNGAFSRSPRGGGMMAGGRPEMMYGGEVGGNPNPFARRGPDVGGGRIYTRDGFDPYSAYGSSFGPGPRGMDYYGELGMMGGFGRAMGGGGNGVHDDNTIRGFSYSSRVRERGPPAYDPAYDFEMGGGGFDGPMMDGGMEYDREFPGPPGGGYGGFDGEMDMGHMGP